VWKTMPLRDGQEPDVVLTMAGGERIMEPYTVYIYDSILFVGTHIGSKVLIYKDLMNLTDDSEPDLIITKIHGAIHDIFYDGRYLFISSGSGIHIYHGLPEEDREAEELIAEVDLGGVRYSLDPWGLYFDGDYLWVFTGCSEHYSFILRIPRKGIEARLPERLIREDFEKYLETGVVPEFLKPFERWRSSMEMGGVMEQPVEEMPMEEKPVEAAEVIIRGVACDPPEPFEGEEVEVLIDVENIGGDIPLLIVEVDGSEVEIEGLGAGETRTVMLHIRPDMAGENTYTVKVEDERGHTLSMREFSITVKPRRRASLPLMTLSVSIIIFSALILLWMWKRGQNYNKS